MSTVATCPVPTDRASLLGALDGTVVEIGPGGGENLRHYRPGVRWIGVEPDRSRHPAIRREAARLGIPVDLRPGVAQDLDLPDASVDAVVGTLVLCSVSDVGRCLAEVRRVLRPAGRYVFDEHVAAPRGTWLRRGQALAARVCGGECRLDRETWVDLGAAGFRSLDYRHDRMPGPFGVRLPFIVGTATV